MSLISSRTVAWTLCGIVVGLDAASLLLAYADRSVHLLVYGYSSVGLIPLAIGGNLAFATIGALVASRLPRNPIGWLFLGIGLMHVATSDAQLYAVRGVIVAPHSLPAAEIAGRLGPGIGILAVGVAVTLVPLLFPDGKPPGRFWRAWAVAVVAVLLVQSLGLSLMAVPGPHLELNGSYAIENAGGLALFLVTYILVFALGIGCVVSLFARRRRADAIQRQQLKFFLFAGVIVLFGPVGSAVGNTAGKGSGLIYDLGGTVLLVTLAALPVGAGLAILRYRLYDIDVVISRTIVYGAMAALITGAYVGIVVGLGSLVGSTGRNNLFLSIVATAVVALAFQPLRARLQRVANRIVYGKHATPYEVLAQFSEGLGEASADWNAVLRMARLVGEATDATRAEVWSRVGNSLKPSAVWPEGLEPSNPVAVDAQLMPPLQAPVAVPVRHGGDLLGAITVTKRGGAELTPVESKLLHDLARQAGLVLHNVGLTVSLQQRLQELHASRQRLVAAQDQERRRLERNLHDGAQQNLVALKVKLGLLRATARKDLDKAEALMLELGEEADGALDNLRDLARGIYPPLLADQGLKAALEAQARKSSVPVVVDVDGLGRFAQEIEAAVYFCCLEGLQNVSKYAAASSVRISVSADDRSLTFCVEDDGAGFDPARVVRGAGLTNMADRLDALGGEMTLTSSPGRGTRVTGSLPVAGK